MNVNLMLNDNENKNMVLQN